MESPQSPQVRSLIPITLILVIIGIPGLVWVLQNLAPNGGSRWAFFFFSILGLTGLALPATAYLNLRFPSKPAAGVGVIVRQALWFGIYFPVLAWLQIGHQLSLPLALLLAGALVVIEVLLRMRERSMWKP